MNVYLGTKADPPVFIGLAENNVVRKGSSKHEILGRLQNSVRMRDADCDRFLYYEQRVPTLSVHTVQPQDRELVPD